MQSYSYQPEPRAESSAKPAVGPSAHWSHLRRHGQADVLASKARDYIQAMLRQDGK